VIRLALRVRREDAELVLAELLELAPAGVEETEIDNASVEYAVYGAPGEIPDLPDLRAAAGGALVEISTSEVSDDWSERWKAFHRPVLLETPVAVASVPPAAAASEAPTGSASEAPTAAPSAARGAALHVRPPWADPSEIEGVQEIVIDPGQAFGTGAHATTRLCLELLLELAAQGAAGPLLDVGTGSGVLAIAGARLGFAPVLGLDHERESVQATRENAEVNGVQLEVRHFDLRSDPLPWMGEGEQRPVVVVANLLRPLLLELADTMSYAPSHLLASGLLVAEVDEIVRAFGGRLGMTERRRRESGEWAAVWLTSG
jgi:ribosomal protein L11 methyltransferase